MAVPMAGVSRKAQALAYISDYIVRHGRSPSMGEIADALLVSSTRAKHLVKALTIDGSVQRVDGAHRGITIEGLAERHVIEKLRAQGVIVNDDFLHPLKCLPLPQGNLPLVAIIEHIPDDDRSQSAPDAR